MRKRLTSRVLLFDESGSILLIRFVVMRSDGEFVFWALPGGEIEPGETAIQAAGRELQEELGVELAVEGPIRQDANQFMHQGEMQDNTDFFFTAGCARNAPRLAGVTPEEIRMMKEARWFSAAEVKALSDAVFPPDLAEWMLRVRS
jgi:ADP-ribose pyrophosphatase YjhB (NUDIX family)